MEVTGGGESFRRLCFRGRRLSAISYSVVRTQEKADAEVTENAESREEEPKSKEKRNTGPGA